MVKKQTAAKVGLGSAILTIFSGVIGIGIFFKNDSVFKNNDFNAIATLITWIISIFFVLCIALSFSQIVSCKTNDNLGLGSWAEQYNGKKIGHYIKILQPFSYYVILSFVLMLFSSEAIINMFICLKSGGKIVGEINFKYQSLAIFGCALSLIIIFTLINYLWQRFAMKFDYFLTWAKFLPIFLVICFGIIGGIVNKTHQGGLWTGQYWESNLWKNSSPEIFSVKSLFAVPGILFAFEGYLIVGNVTNQIDKPEKNVPLSVIVGIVLIAFFYLAITIGCITSGTGNVYQLINILFGQNTKISNMMNIFFSFLLFVCVLGIANSMTICSLKSIQAIINKKILFKSQQLLKKGKNPLFGGLIYYIISVAFLFVATLIPSLLLNTDQFFSCLGDSVIISFYLVYGWIVLGAFINEFTKKVKVTTKIKFFKLLSLFSAITAIFIFAFCSIYQYIYFPCVKPNSIDELKNNWSLFISEGQIVYLTNWQGAIAYWSTTLFLFILPCFNDLLIKKCHQK